MNIEAATAEAVQASIDDILRDLIDVLSELTQTKWVIDGQSFSHENDTLSPALIDRCDIDCHELITGFISQKTSFIPFVRDHFSRREKTKSERDVDLSETAAFGVRPLLQALRALSSLNTSTEVTVQGGGGSGMGWQLYCRGPDGDEALLVSAGYGGGGGYFVDTERDIFSFGGGGGTGMQIYDLNGTGPLPLASVGGGMGCGVADDTDREGTVVCGSSVDEDANSFLFQNISEKLFGGVKSEGKASGGDITSRCVALSVRGGGGGGGGEGIVNEDISTSKSSDNAIRRFGYGFSFFLSTTLFNHTSPHLGSGDKMKRRHDRKNESTSDNHSLNSRLFGVLVESVLEKKCDGNRSDWNCICSNVKDFVSFCLNNATEDIQSEEDELAFDIAESCVAVRAANTSLSWVLNSPCSSPSSRNSSEVDNGATNRDNEDNFFPSDFVTPSGNRMRPFQIYFPLNRTGFEVSSMVFTISKEFARFDRLPLCRPCNATQQFSQSSVSNDTSRQSVLLRGIHPPIANVPQSRILPFLFCCLLASNLVVLFIMMVLHSRRKTSIVTQRKDTRRFRDGKEWQEVLVTDQYGTFLDENTLLFQ